jgi:heme-degrading monooxygenase HmoA
VIHELRIYEIFEHNKEAFHARFRDHARRIMERHGFRFLALWESRSPRRTELVYLLEWPDAETMRDGWDRLREDEEWTSIKRETAARHGELVGEIEDRVLEQVPYSPGRL